MGKIGYDRKKITITKKKCGKTVIQMSYGFVLHVRDVHLENCSYIFCFSCLHCAKTYLMEKWSTGWQMFLFNIYRKLWRSNWFERGFGWCYNLGKFAQQTSEHIWKQLAICDVVWDIT